MPINFPNSPNNGDNYTVDNRSWTYNSSISAWEGGLSTVTGNLVSQNSNSVNITGGTITGLTNLTTTALSAGSADVTGNLVVDTNTLFVDSVNNRVGIGTLTPTAGYALDVNGGLRTTGNILSLGSILYLNAQQSLTQGTNSLTIGSATYFSTINYGNASSMYHVFTAGNVGIGTTTPNEKLTVVGNISATQSITFTDSIYQGATRLLHTTGTDSANPNTFLGLGAGNTTNSGAINNVGIGGSALDALTSGDFNMAVGRNALGAVTAGVSNVGVGNSSFGTITTQSYNVGIGDSSGYSTLGLGNVFLGRGAGSYVSGTNNNNIFIGHVAGSTVDGGTQTVTGLTNAIAIGAYSSVSQSNSLILGGTGTYAVNVGIGTTAPNYKLDVNGTANFADNTTIGGTLVTTGKVTANGQGSLSALAANDVLTKSYVESLIASYIAGAGRRWNRLSYALGTSQGTGSFANGGVGLSSSSAGSSLNSKACAVYESGMSWQSGSGANWVIPNQCMFAGVAFGLLQHGYANLTGVTAGSNQFNLSGATTTLIGLQIWSAAFPLKTTITAVAGNLVTVNNVASTTVAGSHPIVYCYDGVERVSICNTNGLGLYGFPAPMALGRHSVTSAAATGATSIQVTSLIQSTGSGVAGNSYITLTATNASVVANQLISGNGVPSDARVASVVGAVVNLKDAAGNVLVLSNSFGPATLGFLATSINGYYVMADGIAANTTLTLQNSTTGNTFYWLLSQPTTADIVVGAEVFYQNSETLYYRGNNGFGFEYKPDPATGIMSFQLFAMHSGIVYRTGFALAENGVMNAWQSYWHFIIDYDETTRSLRLFVAAQLYQNSPTPKPINPILTLTLPTGLGGRGSGANVNVQACANSKYAPANTSMLRLSVNKLDYFVDQIYIP